MKGLMSVLMGLMMNLAYGNGIIDGVKLKPPASSMSSSMYVLGDSSVDCGDNTLFYPFLPLNIPISHPCNASDSTLLPHLLARKMGLPYPTPFYSQNGSIQGLLNGVNFGSAQATIMYPISPNHQSLNQQVRQAFETLQILQLQLGQEKAHQAINSSIFYLSFGKDDYINLLSSGLGLDRDGPSFAHVLVDQMGNVIRSLYDSNVRSIVCMGVLPLGCAPRILWERYNSSGGSSGDGGRVCLDEINELVVEYNAILEGHIIDLNVEFQDAQIVFCDVYQGIMEIITNPEAYGFMDVQNACCGMGRYGGMTGCTSMMMACNESSTHVWWDFYNPTPALNSLLADSAWSGQPFFNICRPVTLQKLVSPSLL